MVRFSRSGYQGVRLPSLNVFVAFVPKACVFSMKSHLLAIVLLLPACGGSSSNTKTASASGDVGQEKPASSGSAGSETAPVAPEKTAVEFPTTCAKGGKKEGGDVCEPPAAFAKHLCSAANAASVVLPMFGKGTPWQRMYLARDTEAWDPSGSAVGSTAAKLLYEEEVLVLAFHPPANTGGMQVSGANGTYDVVRWDGVCASLNADELRKWLPPEPGYAAIPWKRLEDGTQQKLLEDGKISLKEGEMKKACKGLSRGQTNPACDRAQKSLSKAVVNYVRNGGAVPTPKVP